MLLFSNLKKKMVLKRYCFLKLSKKTETTRWISLCIWTNSNLSVISISTTICFSYGLAIKFTLVKSTWSHPKKHVMFATSLNSGLSLIRDQMITSYTWPVKATPTYLRRVKSDQETNYQTSLIITAWSKWSLRTIPVSSLTTTSKKTKNFLHLIVPLPPKFLTMRKTMKW